MCFRGLFNHTSPLKTFWPELQVDVTGSELLQHKVKRHQTLSLHRFLLMCASIFRTSCTPCQTRFLFVLSWTTLKRWTLFCRQLLAVLQLVRLSQIDVFFNRIRFLLRLSRHKSLFSSFLFRELLRLKILHCWPLLGRSHSTHRSGATSCATILSRQLCSSFG